MKHKNSTEKTKHCKNHWKLHQMCLRGLDNLTLIKSVKLANNFAFVLYLICFNVFVTANFKQYC